MANEFYTHGSFPSTSAPGSSAAMRAELDSISAGFDKLPVMSGNGYRFVAVNGSASGLYSAPFYTDVNGNLGVGVGPANRLTVYMPGAFSSMAHFVNGVTGPGALNGMIVGTDSVGSGNILVQQAFPLVMGTNNQEWLRLTSAGNFGVFTNAPTCRLDVNDDRIRVRSSRTPASASAAGNAGEFSWDSNYVYICVAANTWKRAALSTW